MSGTRNTSTRIVLEGEAEYRAALKNINQEYRLCKSELEKLDAAFKGQQNTLDALQQKYKVLNDMLGQAKQKLELEKQGIEQSQQNMDKYAVKLEEAKKKNVPIQTLIVMQEVEKYLATGNTESRDWLFKYAFGENAPLPDFPEGEAAEQKKDGISIHLIRGDKPLEQESEEDKATREEARKATAEALKAIGQAAEKAGTDQDAQ